MKYITENVTTSTATLIAKVKKQRGTDKYYATVYAFGTWDGATATLQSSPDGGTTKIDIEDSSGTALSATANKTLAVEFGVGGATLGDEIEIYATTTSAGASTDLDFHVYDNTGG